MGKRLKICLEITKGEILEINRRYRGNVIYDAEIEAALARGGVKNMHRKIALLWRAILVGHPFSDGNKRTALAVTALLIERRGLKASKDVLRRLQMCWKG